MKLALGTVQFGLDYGITNESGQLTKKMCQDILEYAKNSGVIVLDTAAAYGTSEEVLGELSASQSFSIVSKVPYLGGLPQDVIAQNVEDSLTRLKRKSLNGLLLHNELDLMGENADGYYKQLCMLKAKGLVDKIGVSFYSTEVAKIILNRYDLDLIQVPASHLDRRFEHDGVLTMAKNSGVEVHARSLFLQGLLVTEANQRPKEFHNIEELNVFDEQAKQQNVTNLQFALSYLIQTKDIDYAVVGCVSEIQIKEIVEAYKISEKKRIKAPDISTENMSLINPTNW